VNSGQEGQPSRYGIEPLGPNHNRAAFCCGVPALDSYLQQQASQDLKRNLAAVFILTADGKNVAGYYSLSAHSILAAELPSDFAKKLPRFPLPFTLLGRMAVAQAIQGQGWGQFLMLHALKRAWLGSREVASWGVVVDAKSGARDFYLKNEFIPLKNQPDRLILPMQMIERLFGL
jgi:predicted GNAT family N-acyltransferase